MSEDVYKHIDPIDVPVYQSLFRLKPHQIPSYFFNGALVIEESTPEVESMLSGLLDGMQPKLITLPNNVSMQQYYDAKSLIARCEGEE